MKLETALRGIHPDALVLFAMLIFGGYGLFLGLFSGIPPIAFLFASQVVGALVFFFLEFRGGFRPQTGRVRALLCWLAVAAIANDLAYFVAFRFTSVANAAVAHQMVSVFLLLFLMFAGKQVTRNEWISLVIALVGTAVLFSESIAIEGGRDMVGIALGLISAPFLAALILLYGRLDAEGLSVVTINFWRYLISAVVMVPMMFVFKGFDLASGDLLALVFFGLLFAVIASGIHNVALMRARPLHASIIGKSEPAIAALYALLFLKQVPSLTACVGGALIIASTVWLALQHGDPKTENSRS